ncbi:MAG: glycosyltransferase family 39 protein [Candidatus Levyibacteriota bacterium]
MTKFIRHNYFYLLIIIISVGVSVVTLAFQSIRLDEAQSIWVSTKSISQVLHLDAQDVLVPLYEVLLHFWLQIFGNTILAARSLSFLFFVITLPVLYQLAKEMSNKRVAMVTITLFSLSPFIMWYSSEARMYSLFAFVTTWNHLFFVRFIRSGGRASKFGYCTTAILGLYTHYFFIFLLATQFCYLIWCAIINPEYEMGIKNDLQKPPNRSRKIVIIHFLLMLIAAVFFLPWIYFFLQMGAASNSQPLIVAPTSFNIFQVFINFLFGFQSNTIQSILISLWPIFVLSFFFIFTKREEQSGENINYFAFATFLPVILIFLGSYLRPIFLSRYLILVTPTLFILISWIFSGFHKKGSRIIFGILFSVMFILLVYQNIATTTPLKENYAGVANYLQSYATASDIVAVSAPFTIYPIEYTYQGNTKIETIPKWDRYTQGGIPAYSQSQFKAQLASYQSQYLHLFVVLSYDQGYEKNIKDYLDMHYKRLRLKEFSPGLEVREYQLRYAAMK